MCVQSKSVAFAGGGSSSVMASRWMVVCALFMALVLAGGAFGQVGGPYDLQWNTIDGGGGTSSGGLYVTGGTIGQADAGTMAGGSYVLQGGFWAAPPKILGDTDGDGDVDIFDVIDTIMAFGSMPGDPNWNPGADFDGNGIVDIFDVIDVVNNFGTSV